MHESKNILQLTRYSSKYEKAHKTIRNNEYLSIYALEYSDKNLYYKTVALKHIFQSNNNKQIYSQLK